MENNQTTRTMAMEDLHLIRQVLLSIGALGLLQYFFQPAALLLLARRLKRRPEGA